MERPSLFGRIFKQSNKNNQSYSVVPEKVNNQVRTSELGRTGTQDYHGYIHEDFNPDFQGEQAVRIYDKMRKTDGTIAAVIRALKLPILSAEKMINCPDNRNEKQKEITEFVRKNLFEDLEGGFDAFLQEALNYLVFGFYYFEKVHEIKDGYIKLKKLAPRLPSAHYRWRTSKKTVPGVTQLLPAIPEDDPSSNTIREIPMWKLVLFTNEKEGDNHEGVSILRSAYKHWYMKDTFYRIDGIKHERGAGILVITLPEGTTEEDQAKADEMGRNFKMNEQAYIVLPSNSWKVEMLTAGISDQSAGLNESVKHHDRMITVNMLAQFIDLGASSGGSYSLSKDQSSFFGLAVKAIGKQMANVINESIIKELVTLNFGEQEMYPYYSFPSIGEIDYKEMAEVMEKLTNAGLVKNDEHLKVYMHKLFNLPEVTVEDFDDGANAENKKKDDDLSIDAAELASKNYFRPLTFAEQRVKFSEIEDLFNKSEAELKAILDKQTDEAKIKLLKDIANLIDSDDIAKVTDLKLIGTSDLSAKVIEAAKKALDIGKTTAANELDTAIPVTSNYTKKVLETKVNLALESRNATILTTIKTRLLDLMNNNVGKTAALFELQKIIENTATKENDKLIGKVVIDSFDEGRALTFDDMKPFLHGLQRSEILDDVTCATCMTIDGRTLAATDPFTYVGQIHTNCRGMWVGVLKTDSDLPKVTALPKSLLSKFQTVEGVPATNNYTPLKKPIIKRGSRLERKINDGDIEI